MPILSYHDSMGANKRWPHLAAQRAKENELRKARASGPLQSLTDVQVRAWAVPVTIAPRALTMWGHAWVRFGEVDVASSFRSFAGRPMRSASRSRSTRTGCAAGSGRAPCSVLRTAPTLGCSALRGIGSIEGRGADGV